MLWFELGLRETGAEIQIIIFLKNAVLLKTTLVSKSQIINNYSPKWR